MIRSKRVTLDIADGVKTLAQILGVSEPFQTVILNSVTGDLIVGDANLTSNNGLPWGSISGIQKFDYRDNVAENLYFLALSDDQVISVLAF